MLFSDKDPKKKSDFILIWGGVGWNGLGQIFLAKTARKLPNKLVTLLYSQLN